MVVVMAKTEKISNYKFCISRKSQMIIIEGKLHKTKALKVVKINNASVTLLIKLPSTKLIKLSLLREKRQTMHYVTL